MQKIDMLGAALSRAKEEEAIAREARIALEQELINELGAREEGAKTHYGEQFKVTITGKLARTIDWRIYDTIKAKIPENLRPVSYTPKLDEKGVKWLEQNEPEYFTVLSECLSAKPAKTAVSVKLIEKAAA